MHQAIERLLGIDLGKVSVEAADTVEGSGSFEDDEAIAPLPQPIHQFHWRNWGTNPYLSWIASSQGLSCRRHRHAGGNPIVH